MISLSSWYTYVKFPEALLWFSPVLQATPCHSTIDSTSMAGGFRQQKSVQDLDFFGEGHRENVGFDLQEMVIH